MSFLFFREAAVHLLEQLPVQVDTTTSAAGFAMDVIGIMWAFSYSGVLDDRLLATARGVLLQQGMALDTTAKSVLIPMTDCTEECGPGKFSNQTSREPYVVYDSHDSLVVCKPPDWEVDDKDDGLAQSAYQKLSSYVAAAAVNSQATIFDDLSHKRGYLHRLDVPSSGLVAIAKTYTAYYDLQMQLSAGAFAREYIVLCRGWSAPSCRKVTARVLWNPGTRSADNRPAEPSFIRRAGGRPSRTLVKTIGHAYNAAVKLAVSIVMVRLVTGRRHQIRAHLAHIGNPTLHDVKYTSRDTLLADEQQLGFSRNFLHRHRISFTDSEGVVRTFNAALPEDLLEPSARLVPRGPACGDLLRHLGSWLPQSPCWEEMQTLTPPSAQARGPCLRRRDTS